jgi:hypothetical protein
MKLIGSQNGINIINGMKIRNNILKIRGKKKAKKKERI